MDGDWRATVRYLERRYPERWAERSRVKPWERALGSIPPVRGWVSRRSPERIKAVRERLLGIAFD
jgi:hypothetical protein